MIGDLVHGGAIDLMRQQFPSAPTPWVDLSTGINPFSYPYTDVQASVNMHLPTRAMMDACQSAISTAIGAPRESIVLAPGSELLIRLLPTVINPQTVAILTLSYNDHRQVWKASGAQVIETDDPLAYADRADAIVVCNPNNPDGRHFLREDLEKARARLASRGGWLIVDEAYADLNPSLSMAPFGGHDGLIVLRSFGKFFGLAGVRLGAALAPQNIRMLLSEKLGTWPVSGAALEIGTRAYEDLEWHTDIRRRLKAARQQLDEILHCSGIKVSGGTDLYRFIEVDQAHDLWKKLAHHGIYVRRFDWSDQHLRIGLPSDRHAEERLRAALNS